MMHASSSRLLSLCSVCIYLFLYAPLLVLIAFSFTPSEYSVRWEGFTWRWYQAVWQNQPIQEALFVSLMVDHSSRADCHGHWHHDGTGAVSGPLPWQRPVAEPPLYPADHAITRHWHRPAALFRGHQPATRGTDDCAGAHRLYDSAHHPGHSGAYCSRLDPTLEEAAMDLGSRRVDDLLAHHLAAAQTRHSGRRPAGVSLVVQRLCDYIFRGRGWLLDLAPAHLLDDPPGCLAYGECPRDIDRRHPLAGGHPWHSGGPAAGVREASARRMSPSASVELVHVTKRFPAALAVHDLSLTIYQGEFFALLGPSGLR